MTTPDEAEQALRSADAREPGEDQVAAAREALRLAGEAGFRPLEVQARIILVAALEAGLPGLDVLPHLSLLLQALDDDEVTERQRFEILWECRYALARTRRSTRVPLSAVRRVYADMERRYRQEGVSPQAYAKYRALLARDTESPDVEAGWLRRWRDAARDDLSDCAWCDVATDARILAETDPAAGLRRAVDLIEGREHCGEEPHRLLGEAADWAMRSGQVELAEACHRLGWPLIAGRQRFAAAMTDHAMYLARAGRIGRATRLALETLPHVDGRLDDLDLLGSASRLARVLRAARGHRLLPDTLAGRPAADVIADLDATARDLARRFTARNRSDRVGRRVAETARMRLYPVTASPDALAQDGLERAALGAEPTVVPLSEPLPESLLSYAAALRAASDALDAARVAELIEGWATDRERLLPAEGPEEQREAAYLERRALASLRARRDEGFVERLMSSATAAAELSGDEATVLRTEVEWLHRSGLAGDQAAWTRAESLVERLQDLGETIEAGSALMTLSRHPDPRAGAALAQRAAELFQLAGARHWEATALQAAGFCTAWFDPRQAERLLDRAHDRATALGLPQIAVAIRATQGKAAWLRGDLSRAVDLYGLAAEGADAFGAADPFGLRLQLAEVLLTTRDWDRLHDEARLLVQVAGERGDLHQLATAHRLLGLALAELGDHHEAVEVLEPSVRVLREEGDTLVGPADWALGQALEATERPDLAAPLYARAASVFARTSSVAEVCLAHDAAGQAYWQVGRLQQAAEQYAASALQARSAGDRERLVPPLRALAAVTAAQGRLDDALATLDRVLAEATAIPGDPPLEEQRLIGQLDHQAALMLHDAGRVEDASLLLDQALGRLRVHGDEADVAAVRGSLARLNPGA